MEVEAEGVSVVSSQVLAQDFAACKHDRCSIGQHSAPFVELFVSILESGFSHSFFLLAGRYLMVDVE